LLAAPDKTRFEQLVLPHLNSAATLARWLLRNRADSEDVVQEAVLRAYRFFNRFHGGDARAWLLQITHNAAVDHLSRRRPEPVEVASEEHDPDGIERNVRPP